MRKNSFTTFMRVERGFTLIELLVVITVLTLFGMLILTVFTRTLRGTNKSQIIGIVKQNGQAVLETMDKTIRNSGNVVCPIITPPSVTAVSKTLVVVENGIYTRYRFVDPVATTPLANGFIQQDNPSKIAVGNPLREETDLEFITRICLVAHPLDQFVTITDTDLQTGVSVTGGEFIRDRSAGYLDQVTIKFNLQPGVGAPAVISGQIDPEGFQTTVQLR